MSEDLPHDLILFITRYFNSVEQLEILLLMRETPESEFTPQEISARIHSSPASVRKRLDDLVRTHLLSAVSGHGEPRYRYAPDEVHRPHVDRLAEFYPAYRLRIIQIIFSTPAERIQKLADAFKVRKEDDDNG